MKRYSTNQLKYREAFTHLADLTRHGEASREEIESLTRELESLWKLLTSDEKKSFLAPRCLSPEARYTTGQTARLLGLHPNGVLYLIRVGRLPAYRPHKKGRRYVLEGDLVAYMKANYIPIPQWLRGRVSGEE